MANTNLRALLARTGKAIGLTVLAGVLAGALLFVWIAKDLPRPEHFTEREIDKTTKIFDKSGETTLYTIHGEEKRTPVKLSDMSPHLKKAVIATEDADFYNHRGVDMEGVFRSVWLNVKIGDLQYGGSTISQQLIRSSFLTMEKSIQRKVRELILTLELERRYSKDQILGWYLNQVPFGNNAYGAQAAAETLFDKDASDLTIEESAVLAALIKAPSYFSPYGPHKQELLARKDYVIERMAEENYIAQEKADEIKDRSISFADPDANIKAPHFTLYVKDILEQRYGADYLKRKGLRVYTTLDWELQQKAQDVLQQWGERNEQFNAHNAALTAIRPRTGEIVTLVGSRDWRGEPFPEDCIPGDTCLFEPKFNAATSKRGRQPGSAFKPIVYATAFEKGYSDDTTVVDEKTNFGVWGGEEYIPQNYSGQYRGRVSLRQALAQSINIPAVKALLNFAGIQESLQTARKMGITTLNRPHSAYGPSLVLGGGEVRLLDMATAYSVFANQGSFVPHAAIRRIETTNGEVIFRRDTPMPRRVLSSRSANLITDILSDNSARTPAFPEDSPLNITAFDAAAKTGTTNSYKDAWTIGYTTSLSAGVWVGNNNNTPMRKEPGLVLAAPIWNEFITAAEQTYPADTFPD